MKTLVLCALMVALVGAAHVKNYRPFYKLAQIEPYGITEDLINSTIEAHRKDIPDPLVIDAIAIGLPGEIADIIYGTLNVKNLNVAGLRSFWLRELSINLTVYEADFLLYVPVVNVSASYNGNFIYQHAKDIWGSGTAEFIINDLEVLGSVHVNVGEPVSIDHLKITITISPASTAKITGIMDDPALSDSVSQYITDNAPAIINDYHELISVILSPILQDAINRLLAGTAQ